MTDRVSTTPGDTPVETVPDDYAREKRWLRLETERDAGKRLFFRDEVHGGESPEHTVVFVHGNPENSYTWRRTIAELDRTADVPYRLVAPDHVGFGLSDTADYEMVCQDHADNLGELIEFLDLDDVTLVVHDWGGPIGIGAFLREPDRISNLVVTNSTVFPLPFVGRTFDDYPMPYLNWYRQPLLVPDSLWGSLASYAIFRTPTGPPRLLGGQLLHTARTQLGDFPEPAEARRVFFEQFEHRGNVRSSKRLVRQTRHWGHGNTFEDPELGTRNTRPFYEFIHERIGEAWGEEVDARMVIGRWDPTAKPAVVDQWVDALPQLEGNVDTYPDRGHFIEEREPEAIASAIADVGGLRR